MSYNTGAVTDKPPVSNLFYGNTLPNQYRKPRLFSCLKCQRVMKLAPLNRDKTAAEYYHCEMCKRQITIKEKNEIFNEACEVLKQAYKLKTLRYKRNYLEIVSSVWGSEDNCRTTAKRKRITEQERFEIEHDLIDYISSKLQIILYHLGEFFVEG